MTTTATSNANDTTTMPARTSLFDTESVLQMASTDRTGSGGSDGSESGGAVSTQPHDPHDQYARMAAGFSFHVLGRALRPYQKLVAAAVLESVLKGLGLTFTVMMARQMGKNELSAHLEAGLLARHAKPGATLIKAAPTFRPQVTTSMQRLESLLKAAAQLAPLTRRRPDGSQEVLKPKKEHGYQLVLGDGRISFLSADPAASVVGATASLLLEIDEAQDVDPEKFTRDFRPMASAGNATTILYGTPRGITRTERRMQWVGATEAGTMETGAAPR